MHWHVQYTQNMPFWSCPETRLDTEFDTSKSCFIISFAWWTKLVNGNIILHNVSHKRSLSQSMSAAYLPFLWQSICRVVRELKSCYQVILSRQLSRKVLPEKKKLRNVHFLHLVNFTEFRPFYMANTVFQVGEFVKIVLRVKTSSAVLQPRFSQVTIKSVLFFRYIEFTIASNCHYHYFILPRNPASSRLPSSVFFGANFLVQSRSVLHSGVN